ncbi:ABC transporter permease [Halobaculum sp. MBLA0147]|uniref:ABC transporter permease n=1 Tax=Halobaculum sp. MBLA0147 TaxID=3079934 RepID=UPI0035242C98
MSLAGATPGRLRRAVDDRSATLLVVPLLLFDLAVFVVPFGYLLRIALSERATAQAYVEGSWSVESFTYLATASNVHELFAFTLGFAVVATVVSLAVSLLYAYAMWRADGALRVVLTAGVLVSMFTAIVVKLFAAVLVYSPNGLVNDLLVGSGLLAEPLLLVNNGVGALLGQLYVIVPYSVLAVYSVLATIDESLLEAARDLGAGPIRTVRAVVVPHVVPGLLVGGVISFTWSIGAYAAPLLIGSGSERTAGIAVSDFLLQQFDWPVAAALGLVVTATVFLALVVTWLALSRSGVDTGV